jgi:hypothetical protein
MHSIRREWFKLLPIKDVNFIMNKIKQELIYVKFNS